MQARWALGAAALAAAIGVGAAAPHPRASHPEAAEGLAAQRAGWLADYAALKARMESDYSHLAWFASPQGGVDLPALDRRALRALQQATTQQEARLAVRDFVTSIGDGHFSESPALAPPLDPKPTEPAKRSFGGEEPVSGCAALGYGDRSQAAFTLPFETLAGFHLEADGVTSVFRAGTITSGGRKIGVIRIKNFSQKQYPVACARAWSANPAMDKTGDDFDQAVTDAWFAAMAAQLAAFKAQGVSLVMVDVGSNTGGNDSGDWAARLFGAGDIHSARLLMVASPQAEDYLKEEVEGLDEAIKLDPGAATRAGAEAGQKLFAASRAGLAGRRCAMHWVWSARRVYNADGCSRLVDVGFASGAVAFAPAGAFGERRAAGRIYWPAVTDTWRGAWSGPVYVLTNAATYSSAEMFTAVMKDNGVARTVGVKTGGDGCGFMTEGAPVVLPHLSLRFRMPNCVRLRHDGTDEVAGIAPDLPVVAAEGESARARAVRVLDAVTGDAGRLARAAPGGRQ